MYEVQILNSSRSYLATVRSLAKLNPEGYVLSFTQRLSNWGSCRFRVATHDPLLSTEGNILQPFTNHVRIKRFGVTVWQGVIVKNPQRNNRFIEVLAYSYLYLLSRTLITHDAPDGQGSENYRTFKSGTIGVNLTDLITQAKTRMGAPLSSLTTGTIENPTFPAEYKDSTGASLTGTWTFSQNFQLKFDYRDLFYVIQAFGVYGDADFEVTNDMVFNFKDHIGSRDTRLVFTYGLFGNIEDYDAPQDGDQLVNFIQGVAADTSDHIIHAEASDEASINSKGRIEAVAAYQDVKNTNLLGTRIKQELALVKTGDPELNFLANARAYPLGQYQIGDVINVKISNGPIQVDTLRRIVGINIDWHGTGKERVRILTNKPRDGE